MMKRAAALLVLLYAARAVWLHFRVVRTTQSGHKTQAPASSEGTPAVTSENKGTGAPRDEQPAKQEDIPPSGGTIAGDGDSAVGADEKDAGGDNNEDDSDSVDMISDAAEAKAADETCKGSQ